VSLDISTIDLGYLATPEGTAAFEQAKRWPPAVDATLVVVNTGRNGDYSPPNFASPQDLDAIRGELTEAGIEHQIPAADRRQARSGGDPHCRRHPCR
jgi:hypothetical protein